MGNTFSADLRFDQIPGFSDPKRRKIDKNNILDNKRLFYVRRDVDKEMGSYFEYSHTKLVCNRTDLHRFYLMVAAILYLPTKPDPEKPVSKFSQMIKECDVFGSYVYIEGTDKKLRTLLYTRKKGFPQNKSVSCRGTVNSVIPRHDGSTGHVVIGMMIINSAANSDRHWTRYDDPQHRHESKGFFEMTKLSQINRLMNIVGERDDLFVIYVGTNTSLLMVDVTEPHLITDKIHHNVYTVFQEGSVLAFNCKLYFRFCDTEEDKEYDADSLYTEKRDQLSNSFNLYLFNRFRRDVGVRRVLFLTETLKHTFWTLKVRRISDGFPLECLLCIPSGGQFGRIHEWEKGLRLVNGRQNLKPWIKYIEPVLLGPIRKLPLNVKSKQCYPLSEESDSESDDSEDDISFCGPYI